MCKLSVCLHLCHDNLLLFLTHPLSPSLSLATVSTALCAPVLFTLLTYLLNQIRLFFPLTLSLSPSLLCTLCPYCTHIYLSKNPYGSFIRSYLCNAQRENPLHDLHAAKRNACRTQQAEIIWKSFLPTPPLTPLHPNTFYSYFLA